MPDPSSLALFVAAAFVLLIVPGPTVLYIVARSIDQGRMAGVVSVLGVQVGTLFHVAAATLGISALLVSSALAFNVVKYLGAAYLVFLGVRTLLRRDEMHRQQTPERTQLSRAFWQGMVVNILNPKTALFFFAFLPQFVDPSRGSVALQVLVLGLILTIMGAVSDSMYALLAGTIGGWLRGNLRFLRVQRYVTGGVYIALGLTAALASQGKSK